MTMQGFLPIYSSHVALSVVDNVLLIHEIDSKVALLYDVMSDSNIPISAPLTLLVRGVPSVPRTSSDRLSSLGISLSEAEFLEKMATGEDTVYDAGLVFANPNYMLDQGRGLLWKIHLDLEVCIPTLYPLPIPMSFGVLGFSCSESLVFFFFKD
jgi:hypothetical protein